MADINNDIEKYHKGELTPVEMHALEKKALNDPFLADALEGRMNLDPTEFSDDVAQLRSRLASRIQPKGNGKVIPLWTMVGRIAAGLLLLAVSGFIVFSLLDKPNKPAELALTKSPAASPPVPPAKTDENVPAAEPGRSATLKREERKLHLSTAPAVSEQPSEITTSPGTENIEKINPSTIQGDVTVAEAEKKEMAEKEKGAEKKEFDLKETEVLKDVTMASPVPERKFEEEDKTAKRAKQKDAVLPSSGWVSTSVPAKSVYKKTTVVRGTVTDAADGTPLPGVNVLIKGSNAGVVTDAEGHYQIPLDNMNQELVFSFIGLQAVDVPVDNKESIDVKMEQDVSQLSEVVVVGYTSPDDEVEKKADHPNIYQLAEPAGGRKAFKKYLVDNMHYPEQAIDNKIQGKVTIQFTVETSGTIKDFKVLRGIGFGCDEEVIRLIRQGPAWTPTSRNDIPLKAKVKVRLRFQLPD